MSGSASPSSETASGAHRRAQLALVLFFVIVAGAVSAVYLLVSTKPQPPRLDLRLDGWREAAAALGPTERRDRELAAGLTMGEDEERIRDAMGRYFGAELRGGGDPSGPATKSAQQELRRLLQRYAIEGGLERYRALGAHFRLKFEAALDVLLAAVVSSGERATVYLDRHPLAEETRAFRPYGGAFLQSAVHAGLISEDGHIQEGAEHIPGLSFLVRWYYWLHPVTDYTFQLSDGELLAFWAWKVEASSHLSLKQRFAYIDQLVRLTSRMPEGYPADKVRGVLFARAKRWGDAIQAWREWLAAHPDDERTLENLRYAEELMANRLKLER